MKSSTKILLGILTFLPFLLIISYVLYIFTGFIPMAIRLEDTNQHVPVEFFESISVMIVLIILAVTIKLGITIYYIVHATNNPQNETNTKIMWIVLLVLVGTVTSIVYYFVEILPSKISEKENIGYIN
jgi:TRAP-type C4-dicarboxylate transport system permease small subunit